MPDKQYDSNYARLKDLASQYIQDKFGTPQAAPQEPEQAIAISPNRRPGGAYEEPSTARAIPAQGEVVTPNEEKYTTELNGRSVRISKSDYDQILRKAAQDQAASSGSGYTKEQNGRVVPMTPEEVSAWQATQSAQDMASRRAQNKAQGINPKDYRTIQPVQGERPIDPQKWRAPGKPMSEQDLYPHAKDEEITGWMDGRGPAVGVDPFGASHGRYVHETERKAGVKPGRGDDTVGLDEQGRAVSGVDPSWGRGKEMHEEFLRLKALKSTAKKDAYMTSAPPDVGGFMPGSKLSSEAATAKLAMSVLKEKLKSGN